MTAIREKAKKFSKFVKGLQGKYPQAVPDPSLPLLDRFVFYLLFYSNPTAAAKKAYKGLTDDKEFASWSEVRVATVREIADILEESKVKPAGFLAARLKIFLQKVFEETDGMSLEPLAEALAESENAKARKDQIEQIRKFVQSIVTIPGLELPPWGLTYLLTGLGIENAVPWDPHTESTLEAQKVFPAKSTLTQRKRVAKALMDGVEGMTPLDVHHLLVEHAKRETKR